MLSEICGFPLFCSPSAGSNVRAISEEDEEGKGRERQLKVVSVNKKYMESGRSEVGSRYWTGIAQAGRSCSEAKSVGTGYLTYGHTSILFTVYILLVIHTMENTMNVVITGPDHIATITVPPRLVSQERDAWCIHRCAWCVH